MENYKQIKQFPNYEINDCGIIRNIKTKRELKQQVNKKGYAKINLYIENKPTTIEVQRLVALTHIPNPHNLEQVDHIDWDKLNNKVSNLRWVSKCENIRRRVSQKPIIYFCDIRGKFILRSKGVSTQYDTIELAVEEFLKLIPHPLRQLYSQ